MPRVPPLDRDRAADEAAPLFDADLKAFGEVLNSTAVAAYRPAIAVAAKQLGKAVANAGLIPEQLRLLINVRVAALVGCPF
jgi:hypothetical protein